jgi:hypothetical protein
VSGHQGVEPVGELAAKPELALLAGFEPGPDSLVDEGVLLDDRAQPGRVLLRVATVDGGLVDDRLEPGVANRRSSGISSWTE